MVVNTEDLLPVVSQVEFDAITCNQCGDCCEAFWQPGPLDIINYYVSCDIIGWQLPKLKVQYTKDELITKGWNKWLNEDPIDARRKWLWFSNMTPTGIVNTVDYKTDVVWNSNQYSCAAFKRLNNNEGICTIWEDRPEICRGFPYGKPAGEEFPRCSWRVKIKEEIKSVKETDGPFIWKL